MEHTYNYFYVLTAVAVMAIVTYIPRMLPLTFMRRKIQNRFIRSFLYYVPYAVLAAMTLPGILYSTSNMVSAITGMAAAIYSKIIEAPVIPLNETLASYFRDYFALLARISTGPYNDLLIMHGIKKLFDLWRFKARDADIKR